MLYFIVVSLFFSLKWIDIIHLILYLMVLIIHEKDFFIKIITKKIHCIGNISAKCEIDRFAVLICRCTITSYAASRLCRQLCSKPSLQANVNLRIVHIHFVRVSSALPGPMCRPCRHVFAGGLTRATPVNPKPPSFASHCCKQTVSETAIWPTLFLLAILHDEPIEIETEHVNMNSKTSVILEVGIWQYFWIRYLPFPTALFCSMCSKNTYTYWSDTYWILSCRYLILTASDR